MPDTGEHDLMSEKYENFSCDYFAGFVCYVYLLTVCVCVCVFPPVAISIITDRDELYMRVCMRIIQLAVLKHLYKIYNTFINSL